MQRIHGTFPGGPATLPGARSAPGSSRGAPAREHDGSTCRRGKIAAAIPHGIVPTLDGPDGAGEGGRLRVARTVHRDSRGAARCSRPIRCARSRRKNRTSRSCGALIGPRRSLARHGDVRGAADDARARACAIDAEGHASGPGLVRDARGCAQDRGGWGHPGQWFDICHFFTRVFLALQSDPAVATAAWPKAGLLGRHGIAAAVPRYRGRFAPPDV
jgi:hypothetical protein